MVWLGWRAIYLLRRRRPPARKIVIAPPSSHPMFPKGCLRNASIVDSRVAVQPAGQCVISQTAPLAKTCLGRPLSILVLHSSALLWWLPTTQHFPFHWKWIASNPPRAYHPGLVVLSGGGGKEDDKERSITWWGRALPFQVWVIRAGRSQPVVKSPCGGKKRNKRKDEPATSNLWL